MTTRVFYFMVDGSASMEKIRRVPPLLEMPDGYHPVTNDSIWQDAKRIRDPLMVLIQRVRAPYGGTMENEDVSNVLFEIELEERAFKAHKVSKMWARAFGRAMDFILTKGIFIVIIIFIAYYLVQAMLGGL